ncbi:MAG: ABC transporter permease [Acidimicrobiales bacterium]
MSKASRLSPSRSWAVVRHEVRIFRRDPVFFAIFTTMPLIVMAFIIPAFRYLPSAPHSGNSSGADQAVPGMAVLFALGGLLFDLRIKGSTLALAVLAASFSISLVCLGLALLAICKTILQLNAIANLGAIVLAGIGGAIVPTTTLPGWAKSIAPFTPGHWAMRGFRNVILDGAGFAGVATSIGVLLAFSAAFVAVAAWRFRFTDNKTSFA